jgi:hypothetical protein
MRNGFLGSLTAMLTAAGLVMAQAPAPSSTPTTAESKPETAGQPQTPVLTPDGGPGVQLIGEPLPASANRFYASGEYLLWFAKGARLPPLATANSGTPASFTAIVPPTTETVTFPGPPPRTITETFSESFMQTQAVGAILGRPGTVVVIGNTEVDDEARSGALLTAGVWLDSEQTIGIECSGFLLEPHSSLFTASSKNFTGLGQPFVTTLGSPLPLRIHSPLGHSPVPIEVPRPSGLKQGVGSEDVFTVGTFVDLAASESITITVTPPKPPKKFVFAFTENFHQSDVGSVDVATSSLLGGTEANVRIKAGGNSNYHVDLLGGFRFLELKDRLNISSLTQLATSDAFVVTSGTAPPQSLPLVTSSGVFYQLPGSNSPFVSGGVLSLFDLFDTRNQFYGGQIGSEAEFLLDRWVVNLRGKLGLGVMHQQADVFGVTNLVTPSGISAFAGGLYAQASNSGSHRRDVFGVVPELGINVGYQVSRHLRATVGYSGLFALGCVIRPGDQLDRTLNPNLVPALFDRAVLNSPTLNPFGAGVIGPARPAFTFKDTDFWVQGLNAGLELDF